MKNKVVKRNKAFLGSIIGAVGGIIGSAIGAAKRKKAEEKAFKMQQEEQYRQDSLAAAQAMTQSYANQDYVDEYKKKVVLNHLLQYDNLRYLLLHQHVHLLKIHKDNHLF